MGRKNDEYFKFVLSVKDNAQEFMQKLLPNDLVGTLKLETLELDNTSYVDTELSKFYSDVVFNCDYVEGDSRFSVSIIILIDHKSEVPEYPHLSMLKYFQKIWDYNIRQNEPLKVIIPIFVFHGIKEWRVKEFKEYFESVGNATRKFLPLFDYLIINISGYDYEYIRDKLFERKILSRAMSVLRLIYYERELSERLDEVFELDPEMYTTYEGEQYVISTARYILSGSEKFITSDMVFSIIKKKRSGLAMTALEELYKEAKLEDAKAMLEDGISDEKIMKYTGLSKEDIQKLRESN